jgi:hypothetical protein
MDPVAHVVLGAIAAITVRVTGGPLWAQTMTFVLVTTTWQASA